jgi:WD40 repeat protein
MAPRWALPVPMQLWSCMTSAPWKCSPRAQRPLPSSLGLAFSPDNKTLVSGGYDGRTLLWNARVAAIGPDAEGAYGHLSTFSPDGTFMATCARRQARPGPAATLDEADALAQAAATPGMKGSNRPHKI